MIPYTKYHLYCKLHSKLKCLIKGVEMSITDKIGRRNVIPHIYVKGTHYEVGFTVGRTFSSITQEYIKCHTALNNSYLPAYNTVEGKKNYDATLDSLRKNFPQYVRELEGNADGAQVPFHKLMLLHMDEILPKSIKEEGTINVAGCSTVVCNYPGQEILGHNEDALEETFNKFYLVSAHVKSDQPQGKWKVKEEKFTTLCYAGMLPGYTMSYNQHGLAFTVNIIMAKHLRVGKTPRSFLCRSLLAAENLSQVEEMLRDKGTGLADGFCINLIFLKDPEKIFYNCEVAPPAENENESKVSTEPANKGEKIIHMNRYLRLLAEEGDDRLADSSTHRHERIDSLPPIKTERDVVRILGDTEDKVYPVFREEGQKDGDIKTIATGIFNCSNLTWSIYSDNPKTSEPLVVLPMVLKN